ncbi:MAG: hypothetical protein ABI781_08160 [Burkholderiales bacterium]
MRSSKPLLKNMLARAFLALAFLFAQQTASLHWLSHAIDATHAKAGKGAPAADHCDECLTLSALGAGAPSSSAALPTGSAQHALFASATPVASPAALRLAFRSRAPPTLV